MINHSVVSHREPNLQSVATPCPQGKGLAMTDAMRRLNDLSEQYLDGMCSAHEYVSGVVLILIEPGFETNNALLLANTLLSMAEVKR